MTPGAKRGRKPSPLPTGMARAVRTRSGVEFYAEGWPEGVGPTWASLNAIRRGGNRGGLRGANLLCAPSPPKSEGFHSKRRVIIFSEIAC